MNQYVNSSPAPQWPATAMPVDPTRQPDGHDGGGGTYGGPTLAAGTPNQRASSQITPRIVTE